MYFKKTVSSLYQLGDLERVTKALCLNVQYQTERFGRCE